MKFAVEMSSSPIAGYAKVHKAGCKDLRDPEPFEAEPTKAGVAAAIESFGWDEDSYTFAPCVKLQKAQ